jgi:thymidine kinase
MFANKTGSLMLEVKTLRQYGQKRVLVFKPTRDTRSGIGRIKNQSGDEMEANEIPETNPLEIIRVLKEEESKIGGRFHVLAFDETNFFPSNSGFFQLVCKLLDSGYDIIAAGLPFDFRGEPFGSTLLLTGLALDKCRWLTAYCTRCGKPAMFSQRLIDGGAASYDSPQVLVGGKDTYEPRCPEHFVLPDKPAPPL